MQKAADLDGSSALASELDKVRLGGGDDEGRGNEDGETAGSSGESVNTAAAGQKDGSSRSEKKNNKDENESNVSALKFVRLFYYYFFLCLIKNYSLGSHNRDLKG